MILLHTVLYGVLAGASALAAAAVVVVLRSGHARLHGIAFAIGFLAAQALVCLLALWLGDDSLPQSGSAHSVAEAIVQIALIDFIFSIDSIVTAIGMAQHLPVMILAIILSMLVMFLASGAIAHFIRTHPTTKALALAFLILIGTSLIADGCGFHVPRGYIYFAMAFAAAIEAYHVAVRRRRRKL